MAEAAELRALARVERDPRKRVRLLAIANVREGMPVAAAERAAGMGRATLYRWLARERASRAWRADRRLLDAYQAEVISLEELIGRRQLPISVAPRASNWTSGVAYASSGPRPGRS